ncbi:conserved hypothetical protein [Ricinus communis]|uniref:Uncharacterized protein n=1 Tax=Ricinus communis TaxID=3988 RepID=B9RWU3_RICCO|nr:conserved hypothetical protein [Ricinus communis]
MNQRKQGQDEQDVQALLAKFSIKYKKIIMLEVVVDNHVEEIADMDINMGVAMEEVIKNSLKENRNQNFQKKKRER